MFNLPPPVPNRVARAGLAIFAVATMALAPNAVWAQATDPFQPIAPAIDVIKPDADLTVTQIAPNTVRVGDFLTYRLKVTNNGPSNSMSVRFGDQLPLASVFVTASAGCAVGNAPTYVTCQIGNLASGASTWRSITVRPSHVGPISNWSRVMSPITHDPVSANDVSILATTVTP